MTSLKRASRIGLDRGEDRVVEPARDLGPVARRRQRAAEARPLERLLLAVRPAAGEPAVERHARARTGRSARRRRRPSNCSGAMKPGVPGISSPGNSSTRGSRATPRSISFSPPSLGEDDVLGLDVAVDHFERGAARRPRGPAGSPLDAAAAAAAARARAAPPSSRPRAGLDAVERGSAARAGPDARRARTGCRYALAEQQLARRRPAAPRARSARAGCGNLSTTWLPSSPSVGREQHRRSGRRSAPARCVKPSSARPARGGVERPAAPTGRRGCRRGRAAGRRTMSITSAVALSLPPAASAASTSVVGGRLGRRLRAEQRGDLRRATACHARRRWSAAAGRARPARRSTWSSRSSGSMPTARIEHVAHVGLGADMVVGQAGAAGRRE